MSRLLSLLQCVTAPIFPCLLWSWHFRRVLTSCFVECLSICVCSMFSNDQILKLRIFGKNIIEVMFSVHPSRYMMSIWLTACDVNLDYLVEVVPVRFLHCKVTICFTFKVNRCLGRKYFETVNIVFLIILFCIFIFTSISGSCLQQLLLWCLANGNFLLQSFLL